MNNSLTIPEEIILNKIYLLRDQKVMLDRDLADLFGIETKVLKQSVKRNIERFPEDFMFEMSSEEFKNWRSQFVTSNSDKQGLRYAPFCFTEQGVTMLSCILNSKRAIHVNIQIVRIFTKLRQFIVNHSEIRLEIEEIKKQLNNHNKNIEVVFQYLDELLEKKDEPKERVRIGFRFGKDK